MNLSSPTEDGHYHLHLHTISKLKGYAIQAAAAYRRAERFEAAPVDPEQSITQAAAYRRAQKLGNDGRVFDYRRKVGVAWTGILAPAFTPKELLDAQTLWNTVERIESRKNARLAREMIIALPHQVDMDVHIELLRTFITANLTARGMVADVAIHCPPVEHGGDPRNWHAHVLLTDRPMTPNGFAAKKDRTWNARENLLLWREAWADCHNAKMQELGLPYRISHLSLEAQRKEALAKGDVMAALELDREPQIHVGKAHHATHPKHTIYAERRDLNAGILTRNKDRAAIRADRMRGQIAKADNAAHLEGRRNAYLRDTWTSWDEAPLTYEALESEYGRPAPTSALGRIKAAGLQGEATRRALAISREHGHPWRAGQVSESAPSLFDILRSMVAKTGPGHPVFTVTAKDLVFLFYGLGITSLRDLQTSLENIAQEEQFLFADKLDKQKNRPKPRPRPTPPKLPTPKAEHLARLRSVAYHPEQAYQRRLVQLAVFEKRHQAKALRQPRKAGVSHRRYLAQPHVSG